MKLFLMSITLVLFTCNFTIAQSNKAVAEVKNGNMEFIDGKEKELLDSYNKTYKLKTKLDKLTIKKSGNVYYISGRSKSGGFSFAQALENTRGNYYRVAANSCTCTTSCTEPGECDAYISNKGCGCTSCDKECTKSSTVSPY